MVITCIVAPLALAGILGFAFAEGDSPSHVTIGVAGARADLVRAAEHAAQLPRSVSVRIEANRSALKEAVADGSLDGGVVLSARPIALNHLLIPIIAPGATPSPGFDVMSATSSLAGQQWSESMAAALSSRLYAGRLVAGSATNRAAISVESATLGNASKGILNYFAPSIAVIFLFVGAGLGMRSLLLERSSGTLVRMAAAPLKPNRIVFGKLLAIFITGIVSILVVWGATTFFFGADWGDPLGVLLMCIGATAAMCGLGVFLTSWAKDEQSAFGVALIVGLVLALLGGNLLPPGALPHFLQVAALGTPNGWAQVGFGRLSLLSEPASAIINPFLILMAIAVVTGGLAMTRVNKMVEP